MRKNAIGAELCSPQSAERHRVFLREHGADDGLALEPNLHSACRARSTISARTRAICGVQIQP